MNEKQYMANGDPGILFNMSIFKVAKWDYLKSRYNGPLIQ